METKLQKLQQFAETRRGTKNSLAYKSAIEAIEKIGSKISTGKNTGSGRYASSTCWGEETIWILNQIGVTAEVGNDSPRGGRAGEYVIIKEG